MISPCTDFRDVSIVLRGRHFIQVLASGNASSWCDRILAAKQKLPWRLVSQRFVGALGRPLEVMLWPLGLKKMSWSGFPGFPIAADESTFAAWEPHEVISSWCFPSPKGEEHSFKLLTIHGIKHDVFGINWINHDVFVWRGCEKVSSDEVPFWVVPSCLLLRFMAEKALKGLHASIDLVIKDFRCDRGWCFSDRHGLEYVGIDSSWQWTQWTPHVSRKSWSKLEISHCCMALYGRTVEMSNPHDWSSARDERFHCLRWFQPEQLPKKTMIFPSDFGASLAK